MTKSLTEKWKDGELEFGYYYIDFGIGGVPMLFNGLEFYCERTQKPNAIKTILAPVPSYEEYKELKEYESKVKYDNITNPLDCMQIVIDRLEEQLKEANDIIKDMRPFIQGSMKRETFTRILHYENKWGVK